MEKAISDFIAVLLGLLTRLRSKLDDLASKMSAVDDEAFNSLKTEALALHSKLEDVFEIDVDQVAALEEHWLISDAIDELKTRFITFHHQLFRELNIPSQLDSYRLDWIFEQAVDEIFMHSWGNLEDRFYELYESLQISVSGYDKMIGHALNSIVLSILSLGNDQYAHLRGPFFDLVCRTLTHVVVRFPGSIDNWEYGCISYFLPLTSAYPKKRIIHSDGAVTIIENIPMRDAFPAKDMHDRLWRVRKQSTSTRDSQ